MVVVHHSGRRDLYVAPPAATGDEPRASFSLSDDEARRLGAVLGGAYFKPAVVADVEARNPRLPDTERRGSGARTSQDGPDCDA